MNRYGNNIAAIASNGESIRYSDLEATGDRIGNSTDGRCLVFCFCENEIGALCGYVGFLKNNIVPLLLKSDIEAELRENLIAVYKPAYLYMPSAMTQEFPEFEKVYEEWNYVLLRTQFHFQKELNPQLALLLTTSGSTGSPKLVRQSYDNIQSNAESIVEYLELTEYERPITTLPMNYTYGLSIINSHLLVGATILMTKTGFMQREFWEFFKAEEATSFGGIPYNFEILKKLRFFSMNLPSLRTMTQAGGKLSPELHKEFAEFAAAQQKRFIVMYGQTEATARMAYLPHQYSLEKYGSMGIAIPGGTLSLHDGNGKEISEADTVGELVYKGPNVTLGYAVCEEDLAKADERNGILETGDMAKRDEDGFYYIVGRKSRFLKIFGNRVNLDETEAMVKRAFEDLDCACSGVDDKLYVFLVTDDQEDCDRVKTHLAGKMKIHPSAFHVKRIEQIPKNDSGKTLLKKLEEYYD
jgi:acyl-coenzyme A synthetase/AMP-(fatty) acid ligase